MKRNLRYIILVISVGLVGIILFQVYWISNSYDLHNRTFRIEANAALEQALNQDLEAATLDQILGVRDSMADPITIETLSMPVDTVDGKARISLMDTTIPAFSGKYTIRSHIGSTDEPERYVYIDKEDINKILSRVVLNLANLHPDLSQLEEKYRDLLDQKRINIPFYIAYSRNGGVYALTGGNPDDFIHAQAIQKLPGINPEGEQVMAFFPETRSFILKRMWATLFASVLLVMVITGSFFYLLLILVRQKKLSEIKNDFINNMTHELKTPISTVSAAMEALVNFNALDDKDKSLKYIELSRRELGRLSGMVENVLRLSTFEKQKLVLNKETFNISALLEETAHQFMILNPDKIRFSFELKDPAYVHADKFHMMSVISNLFDNAVKYSGETVKIEVSCERSNEFVVFRVRDHGVGISREQQNHIFEKFYRVPTGDLHAVKGFGLGLSYVRQIVEAHGGTVGVKSQIGTGSEFIVAIPEIH